MRPLPMKPLYQLSGGHPKQLPGAAHAGLWYDKFYEGYYSIESAGDADPRDRSSRAGDSRDRKRRADAERERKKLASEEKPAWIRSVCKTVGDAARIGELVGRRRRMIELLDGELAYFESQSRFVTGLGREHPVENGFAWHPTLGVPYLPGSSLKGLVRTWAREQGQDDLLDHVFGAEEKAGAFVFLDLIPVIPVALEADVMTPHYGPYYQNGEMPGDWHSPNPIPFLTAAAGMKVQAGLVYTPRARLTPERELAAERADILQTVVQWVKDALSELGAGAKTAVGYGRFRPFDGSAIGSEWVRDVEAQRLAALTPRERARREVEKMNDEQARECLLGRIDRGEEADPEYREALREALRDKVYQRWSDAGLPNTSKDKIKRYLRILRGEAEPAADTAPAALPAPGKKKDKKKRRDKKRGVGRG